MIYDFGTEVSLNGNVGQGNQIGYGTGSYDLKGGGDGDPALFGTGERLYMQFEVTTAFTANNAPVAQFGVAIGPTAALDATSHVLALTGGSINATGFVGFLVGQLVLGATFHLSIPSWEDILESAGAEWPNTLGQAERDLFRALRFMGIVLVQPMVPTITTGDYFTGGAVKARIIKDPSGTAVLSNIYESRMRVN